MEWKLLAEDVWGRFVEEVPTFNDDGSQKGEKEVQTYARRSYWVSSEGDRVCIMIRTWKNDKLTSIEEWVHPTGWVFLTDLPMGKRGEAEPDIEEPWKEMEQELLDKFEKLRAPYKKERM